MVKALIGLLKTIAITQDKYTRYIRLQFSCSAVCDTKESSSFTWNTVEQVAFHWRWNCFCQHLIFLFNMRGWPSPLELWGYSRSTTGGRCSASGKAPQPHRLFYLWLLSEAQARTLAGKKEEVLDKRERGIFTWMWGGGVILFYRLKTCCDVCSRKNLMLCCCRSLITRAIFEIFRFLTTKCKMSSKQQ